MYHSGKNNELQVSHPSKDLSLRDSHSVICNQEAEVSSSNSGEDNGEETRRKQASEGPYSGSMGMFASGTPQRVFQGQRNNAESLNVGNVAMGSPEHKRATKTLCAPQYSGGHALLTYLTYSIENLK